MNSCSRACRDLPLFLGGDLDAARSGEVGAHLRGCPACRREAMGLQQALKQLQRIATPAVDESTFAAMHAVILERVEAGMAGSIAAPRGSAGWRLWWAMAAAAALFLAGWWFVRPPAVPAALERAPIAVPVGHSAATLVVPYAGERVPLRLLGDDVVSGEQEAGRGAAPGMMGRWRLRTLVDEQSGEPWPRVAPRPQQPPGARAPGAPAPGSVGPR